MTYEKLMLRLLLSILRELVFGKGRSFTFDQQQLSSDIAEFLAKE